MSSYYLISVFLQRKIQAQVLLKNNLISSGDQYYPTATIHYKKLKVRFHIIRLYVFFFLYQIVNQIIHLIVFEILDLYSKDNAQKCFI